MQTLTDRLAHQQAVRCTASMWHTLVVEGRGDPTEVSFSSLIGRLPQEGNGSPVYVVYVQGTVQACCGETYPVDQTVTVRLSENGEPIVRVATDQEVEQAQQHSRGEACEEYGC